MTTRDEHYFIITKYYAKGYITRKEKTEILRQLTLDKALNEYYAFITTPINVDGREIYYISRPTVFFINCCLEVYTKEGELDFKVEYDTMTEDFTLAY